MTAAHTPGPWFCPSRSHGTRYVEARIGGGMLQEVAACGPTEQPEQQEANARLIAAAPELLDALRWALGFLPPCTPINAQVHCEYRRQFNQALAALAKATGAKP